MPSESAIRNFLFLCGLDSVEKKFIIQNSATIVNLFQQHSIIAVATTRYFCRSYIGIKARLSKHKIEEEIIEKEKKERDDIIAQLMAI